MSDKPRLRPIEAFPIKTDEGTLICLRDPSGISDRMVTMSPGAVGVLEMLDGNHTVRDIQLALTRQAGELVMSDPIVRMIDVLEDACLLEGERFETYRRKLYADFAAADVRPATSAGGAYPDDPDEARAFLDDVLAENSRVEAGETFRGLIVPHIDYQRGRKTYAAAFSALAGTEPADCFVILGTAHAFMQQPFALTRKDFQTPLGTAATDTGFVDALAASNNLDLFADEFVHRGEHSVELTLVFIQHLMRKAGREFRIVPVICGGATDAVQRGASPSELPGVGEFIHALRSEMEERSERVMLVASADLSHVGPRFGGRERLNANVLEDLERADRETLSHVEAGDPEGFFGHIALDENARNICGIAPIYTLLKTLSPDSAKLLHYQQWTGDDALSCVTFSAAVVE